MHAGMREAGHDGSASSFRSRSLGPTDEAKSEAAAIAARAKNVPTLSVSYPSLKTLGFLSRDSNFSM